MLFVYCHHLVRKHEKANTERKLTPEERKAKTLRKMKEDLSCGVHVTVYRVKDMSNPAIKFKVDMNAQQFHLTGCMLLYQDVNIIIVEGGGWGDSGLREVFIARVRCGKKSLLSLLYTFHPSDHTTLSLICLSFVFKLLTHYST